MRMPIKLNKTTHAHLDRNYQNGRHQARRTAKTLTANRIRFLREGHPRALALTTALDRLASLDFSGPRINSSERVHVTGQNPHNSLAGSSISSVAVGGMNLAQHHPPPQKSIGFEKHNYLDAA